MDLSEVFEKTGGRHRLGSGMLGGLYFSSFVIRVSDGVVPYIAGDIMAVSHCGQQVQR